MTDYMSCDTSAQKTYTPLHDELPQTVLREIVTTDVLIGIVGFLKLNSYFAQI